MAKRDALRLHRETVRELDGEDLLDAAGGYSITCFAGCSIPPTVIFTINYTKQQLSAQHVTC